MGKDKFAKLFERDGEQVLVRKDDLDDGKPAVFVTFDVDGLSVTVNFSFDDDHDGYEARNALFETVNENAAFEVAKKTTAQLKEMAEK